MAIRHSTPADGSFSAAGKVAWDAGHDGDASDLSFVPSGTGAIATTVQAKLREYVSVTDFYANGVSGVAVDPTGVVDSTLGIQAALDTGKRVFFPPGTYKTTATLNLNATANIGQIVYGSGCLREDNATGTNKTIIQPSSAVSVAVGVVGGALSIRGFELRDFTIDMTNMTDASTRIGIKQSSAWSAKIKNITFVGIGTSKRILKFEAASYLTTIENVRTRGGIVELAGNSLADAVTTLTFLNCDVDQYVMNNAASISIIGGAIQGTSDKLDLQTNVEGLFLKGVDIEGASGTFLKFGTAVHAPSLDVYLGGFSGTFSSGTPTAGNGLFYRRTTSWTPTMTFGGAAVGLTYANQGASATKIGDRVFGTLDFIINDNGSSSGSAVIAGLPYPGNASFNQDFAINVNNGTLTGQLFGRIAPGASTIALFVTNNGSTAAATEANITNSCTMRATFSYMPTW